MMVVRHDFEVDDEDAIADRTDNRSIEVKRNQTVFVYIEKKVIDSKDSIFSIYAGLPTVETVNTPLYIDAPFHLVASREYIHNNKWNKCVANEVLTAVVKAFAEIATVERIDVLDFIPKNGELFGGKFAEFIQVDFAQTAKQFKLLPTLNKEQFASPFGDLVYYPNFVKLLLEKTEMPEIDAKKTIDFFATRDYSTEKYFKVLEYLQCKQADDVLILDIIEKYAWQYLSDKNIRASVFSYLKNIPSQAKQALLHRIKRLRIVPVKALNDSKPVFVSQSEKPIWYGDGEKSTERYNILFIEWLTAEDYDKVFDLTYSATRIKEMNNAQRRAEYESKLNQVFNKIDAKEKYEWLVNEFQTNKQEMEQRHGWFLQNKDRILLLRADNGFDNANNSIFKADVGIYKKIQGEHLKLFLVSNDALNLVDFLQLPSIDRITFSEYSACDEVSLSREDILDLQNSAIIPYYTGVAILAQCKDAGYISDALIGEMGLGGLGENDLDENDYEFPTKPVADIKRLHERIVRLWRDERVKVVQKEVKRTEYVGETVDGKESPILGESTNQYAKQMYSAANNSGICFCQMCQDPKPHKYIEVNKVEHLPEYYWEQLKLSLCLNCSKDFEMLRNNASFGKAFVDAIIDYDFECGKTEFIFIPIGDKNIKFTETHFAEVQQILKIMRKDNQGD
jgi:hypothetical protein